MGNLIEDIIVTPLKKIGGDKGMVLHALKNDEPSFKSFGEAYLSTVDFNAVKGWKRHKKMICNLIVVSGAVEFVIYDDRPSSTTQGRIFNITLSVDNNYCRLTIPNNLWFAFKGVGNHNIILNIASIMHDTNEHEVILPDNFHFYKF